MKTCKDTNQKNHTYAEAKNKKGKKFKICIYCGKKKSS